MDGIDWAVAAAALAAGFGLGAWEKARARRRSCRDLPPPIPLHPRLTARRRPPLPPD